MASHPSEFTEREVCDRLQENGVSEDRAESVAKLYRVAHEASWGNAFAKAKLNQLGSEEIEGVASILAEAGYEDCSLQIIGYGVSPTSVVEEINTFMGAGEVE